MRSTLLADVAWMAVPDHIITSSQRTLLAGLLLLRCTALPTRAALHLQLDAPPMPSEVLGTRATPVFAWTNAERSVGAMAWSDTDGVAQRLVRSIEVGSKVAVSHAGVTEVSVGSWHGWVCARHAARHTHRA